MLPNPAFFNRIAPYYGQQWTIEEESRRAAATLVRNFIQTSSKRSVIVEVGCGNGRMLCNLPPGTIGLDYSMNMLLGTRQRSPTARLVMGSATQLPFRRGSVDLLVAVNVIHNHEDIAPWLREFRLAAGTLVVDFRNFLSPVVFCKYLKYRNSLAINYHPYMPWNFSALLERAGWTRSQAMNVRRPMTDPKEGFQWRHVAGWMLSLLPGASPTQVWSAS